MLCYFLWPTSHKLRHATFVELQDQEAFTGTTNKLFYNKILNFVLECQLFGRTVTKRIEIVKTNSKVIYLNMEWIYMDIKEKTQEEDTYISLNFVEQY